MVGDGLSRALLERDHPDGSWAQHYHPERKVGEVRKGLLIASVGIPPVLDVTDISVCRCCCLT